MTGIRRQLVSAVAGVLGLPLDDRALWPDIILGALLAFSLLFSLGSLITLVFDSAFWISTVAAIALILLAKEKRAVLAAGLLFVGLRSSIAVFIGFQWRAVILALISFSVSGFLLQG